MKAEFEAAAFDGRGLRFLLQVRPAGAPQDEGGHGLQWLAEAPGVQRQCARIGDKRLNVWIPRPIGDPTGHPYASGDAKPVSRWTSGDGTAVQIRPYFFGELRATEGFLTMARRAGDLLPLLPRQAQRRFSADLIDPLTLTNDPALRWLTALFPLAWREGNAVGLTAWRGVVDSGFAPYELPMDPARLRSTIAVCRANYRSGPMAAYWARLPEVPDEFVAVLLPDLFVASKLACDLLLTHLRAEPSIPRENSIVAIYTSADRCLSEAKRLYMVGCVAGRSDLPAEAIGSLQRELATRYARVFQELRHLEDQYGAVLGDAKSLYSAGAEFCGEGSFAARTAIQSVVLLAKDMMRTAFVALSDATRHLEDTSVPLPDGFDETVLAAIEKEWRGSVRPAWAEMPDLSNAMEKLRLQLEHEQHLLTERWLAQLDKAQNPSDASSARPREHPLVLTRPVRISDVATQVNMRTQKLKDKLQRVQSRIAGQNVEFEDLWLVLPEFKAQLTKWANEKYPVAKP